MDEPKVNNSQTEKPIADPAAAGPEETKRPYTNIPEPTETPVDSQKDKPIETPQDKKDEPVEPVKPVKPVEPVEPVM